MFISRMKIKEINAKIYNAEIFRKIHPYVLIEEKLPR